MEIFLNGTQHDIQADNLAEALNALGYRDAIVATAVNGRFIPATARADVALNDGDQIEVVAPMQGG